jgi:molecular chaperone DnaK
MKADAEANASEDEKRKELVDVRNAAEQMIYAGEKALKENGDKIADDIKKDVEDKIGDLRKVNETGDLEGIKKASEALSTAMMKIGEAMSKASQENPATPPAGETPPEAGTTDADFTEKPKE